MLSKGKGFDMKEWLVTVVVVVVLLAWPGFGLAADIGTCEKSSEGETAKHLFFPVQQGKKLLLKLKELKVSKARVALLQRKVEIKEEIIELLRTKNKAAEQALQKQSKALAEKNKSIQRLQRDVLNYKKQAAEARAARVWYLIGGVVGTVVLLGGGSLALYLASKGVP